MKKKLKRAQTTGAASYVALTVVAAAFLLPLLWVVLASVTPKPTQAVKIPDRLTLDNFVRVLTDGSILRAFLNGLLLSGGQMLIVVFCAVCAAYPLSRYSLKFNQHFLLVLLFMTSLPISAVMVPTYHLFIRLNLVDSLPGTMLFMAATSLPYAVWMMKNFMDNVPVELEEAARVDGASTPQCIRRVVLPLMIPGLCTVGIYTFINSWGSFFAPYILLQSPSKIPASVKIYSFFGYYGQLEFGPLAAYSILYMLPSFMLYFLAQNYMSQGFALSGANKG